MRAVVYARLSKLTDRNELNLDDQVTRCREHATGRGWVVLEVCTDAGVSAFDRDATDVRPGFARVVELVRAGAVDVVVAWRPDRLWRDPIEANLFLRDCAGHGVQLVATVLEGDRDPGNPGDEMVTTIVAAVGRYESAAKSARLRAKARQLAEQGRVGGGGTRPFGFEADRVTIRESEAVWVREAARMVVDGVSLHAVCRWLNTVTPTVKGGVWRSPVLRRLLTAPRVAGLREHQGRVIGPAVWDGIVDEATWIACVEVLEAPERRTNRVRRSYTLTGGIARCGLCGGLLVARPKPGGRRAYVCPSPATGQWTGCGRVSVLADPFEAEVAGQVLAALASAVAAPPSLGLEDAAATVDVERLEEQLAGLARDHYVDGLITRGEYLAARQGLAGQLDIARARITPRHRTPVQVPADIADLWPSLPLDEQRAIIVEVVDHVTVGPAVRGRNTFDPARITITWRTTS